jgi:hypothetical protein
MSRYEAQVVTGSGLDAAVAAWLLLSPLFVGVAYVAAALTNNIVCGCVILILAIPRFMGIYRQAWISWINCAIGLWVLISPWTLGFARHHAAMINNVVTGIVIAALACWSALAHRPKGVPASEDDADRS